MLTKNLFTLFSVSLCATLMFVAGCGNEATTTTTAPPENMPTEAEMEEINANYSQQGSPQDRR